MSAEEPKPEGFKWYGDINAARLSEILETHSIFFDEMDILIRVPPEKQVPDLKAIKASWAEHQEDGFWKYEFRDQETQSLLETAIAGASLAGKQVSEELLGGFPSSINEVINKVGQRFAKDFKPIMSDVLDWFTKNNITDEDLDSVLRQLLKDETASGTISAIFMSLLIMGQMGTAYMTSFVKKNQRKFNAKFLPDIPEFERFVPETFYNNAFTDEVKGLMAESGIDPAWFKHYEEGAKKFFGLGEIMALTWREEITPEESAQYLKKAGYQDTELKDVKGLFYNLPGLQDLVQMAVREAFRDDVASEFGYDEEYPEVIEQFFIAQGFDPDWLKRYWRAHWTIPSVQQGFEMLHRRVITQDELNTMLRVQDIPTFWREKLLQISFNPYTRIDVRRLYRTGVIDEDDVLSNYLDLGYDDEHALNLTRFTVLDAMQDERDNSKAEIIKAFHSDIITDREAEGYLQEMGYDKEAVQLIMAVETSKKVSKLADRKLKVIKRRYITGVLNGEQAREALSKAEVPIANIPLLLEEWDTDIEEDQKLPTKADLAKFLKRGIITPDQYKEQMILLGFSSKYVDWFSQVVMAGEEIT